MEHNLLRTEKGKILYNGAKMELFVPNEYFKKGLAEMVGQGYNIFGYARAYHYASVDDDRTKATKSVLNYPMRMMTIPSSVELETIAFDERPEEKFQVFTYYKDDIVFNSDQIIQSPMNTQVLLDMLLNGKLDIIEYSQIPRAFQTCKLWNKVFLGTPATYEEVIISTYYRDPKNPSRPARYAASSHTGQNKFFARGITQRELVGFVSTFAALTFEDLTTALTKADNLKRNGKVETISEIEKYTLSIN